MADTNPFPQPSPGQTIAVRRVFTDDFSSFVPTSRLWDPSRKIPFCPTLLPPGCLIGVPTRPPLPLPLLRFQNRCCRRANPLDRSYHQRPGPPRPLFSETPSLSTRLYPRPLPFPPQLPMRFSCGLPHSAFLPKWWILPLHLFSLRSHSIIVQYK